MFFIDLEDGFKVYQWKNPHRIYLNAQSGDEKEAYMHVSGDSLIWSNNVVNNQIAWVNNNVNSIPYIDYQANFATPPIPNSNHLKSFPHPKLINLNQTPHHFLETS